MKDLFRLFAVEDEKSDSELNIEDIDAVSGGGKPPKPKPNR